MHSLELDSQLEVRFRIRLDQWMKEDFFLPSAREMAGDHASGTRYLIVSTGGAGAQALLEVKKEFETVLPPEQLEARVRFLAVDTDRETPIATIQVEAPDGAVSIVQKKVLEDTQFCHLRSGDVRNLFTCASLPDSLGEWIDPALEHMLRADLARGMSCHYLADIGASGIRQLGRLSLYPYQAYNLIVTRIRTLACEITAGTGAPLRVIILAGISGGTGSGTLVDLAYLIRDTIDHMPESLGDRTEYLGFVLLPPTGNSHNPEDIAHGNRNSYAALKEIDYYMTLRQRNFSMPDVTKREKYSFTYGNGYTVTSHENLLASCYLIDAGSDGAVCANPTKAAAKTIAGTLLALVTADPIYEYPFGHVSCLDRCVISEDTFCGEMLSHTPAQRAPRDANYIYCTPGVAEFSIPTHLIKTYLAKSILDRIYAMFENCSAAEEADADRLLEQLGRQGGDSVQEVRGNLLRMLKPIMMGTTGNKCGLWFIAF